MKRFCLCLFAASLAFAQAPPIAAPKPLTIEAAFAEGGITGREPEAMQWTPDNSTLSFIQRDDSGEHGELWTLNPVTAEKRLLVTQPKLTQLSPPLSRLKDDRERERITRYHVQPYQWSPDSKQLLFNSLGQLWLYTIANGTGVLLSSSPDASGDPKFSPNGNKLAYLRKHNVYVRQLSDSGDASELQLTHTSEKEEKEETVLNGEVDWVYAEELSVRSNYFWSPDSRDIAFLQMDESHVPSYPIVNWLPTHPTVDMEKYPQAGDPNPVVRLGVVSASGGKPRWISLTKETDVYIPRFGWIGNGLLWAEVLNRAQDTLDLYFIDVRTGRSRNVLTESAPGAWVYVNDDFRVLKSGDRFLWSSWRDGTTQLYLYSFDKANPLAADAHLERQLTQGDFEMLGVQGLDENAGLVYFICNKGDARQRQLYAVKLDGSGLQHISQGPGTHDSSVFTDNAKHYVDEFSSLMTPPRLSVCSSSGTCSTFWQSRSVEEYGLIPPRFLDFKAGDGTTLHGELLLPGGNLSDKVPLILNIYGGPAAQLVRDKWIEDWSGSSGLFHQILARDGFAILTVDNRGTPARDRKFQTAIRHQFGRIELEDQQSALDQVFNQYPQLDRSRVGIWGWSNGGSMTLYALTHTDRFKAGAAVSPVTSWRNYDSIYTERNNGLPTDKTTTSYSDLDLAKVAWNLHGSLLLLHGTSDDNVHFQNSIQMVEALIQAGKQFRFMAYPNKTHSIAGAIDQRHLFYLIEDHFLHELK